MKDFVISRDDVKEIYQLYHNEFDENGEIDTGLRESVKENFVEQLDQWLDDLDWEQMDHEILEDDKDMREYMDEVDETYKREQGWK